MSPVSTINPKKTHRSVSLARALSQLGFCSRSQARDLIRARRVQVNTVTSQDPSVRIDPQNDQIAVDGQPVVAAQKVYLMLNKPRGLVTTTSDEKGRATIYHCLEASSLPWVFPVGRLDKASEGLLLLTNDTRWAAHITDPTGHVEKTYHVQVRGFVDHTTLAKLVDGVGDESDRLEVSRARLLRQGKQNCCLELILTEGKNRHIRRMLAALDIEVLRLIRVAVGSLKLGDLKKGEYRHLTVSEYRLLK